MITKAIKTGAMNSRGKFGLPRLAALLLMAFVVLGTFAGNAGADRFSQAGHSGFFGSISALSTDHPRAVAGETDITLQTAAGPVELTATPATVVRIPGIATASIESIVVGDPVAVLANQGQAISILVRGDRPVRSRHFAGVLTALGDDGTVSLRSPQGEHLTALAVTDTQHLRPGELVTAVVEQDLLSNSLLITGLDRAIDGLSRIQSAMEAAQSSDATDKLAFLKLRLVENSTQHLTALQEASQQALPALRSRVRRELESAALQYDEALTRAGAGKPGAEVNGIVTAIDGQRQRITITPIGLMPVEVVINRDTSIELRGNPVRFGQLDLASRVKVRYDLGTKSASRIAIFALETLDRGTAEALVALLETGEISGIVDGINSDVNPPIVRILDPNRDAVVELVVTDRSVVLSSGIPSGLAALRGKQVAANFDPDSLAIIELDTLELPGAEATVSGVVHGVIPKPGVLAGNLFIFTKEAAVRTYIWTTDTVIRRDGQQVTISEVGLGDLVRPISRFRVHSSGSTSHGLSEGEIVLLSLKSPGTAPVQGTITGIVALPDGATQLTLGNSRLELINVVVTADTRLLRHGTPLTPAQLKVGQRVRSGSYDPVSGVSARLVLDSPRALGITGEITVLDQTRSTITIAPRRGAPVQLSMLDGGSTRITLRGSNSRIIDLRVGQMVRAGFYDASTKELLRLIVK